MKTIFILITCLLALKTFAVEGEISANLTSAKNFADIYYEQKSEILKTPI